MPSFCIAHRGLHAIHPENTIESMKSAYESGCDWVEFDVQMSKDGELFLFHDDNMQSLCGIDSELFRLTSLEIEATLLIHPTGRYHIPTLESFLEDLGRHPYFMELKIPSGKSRDPMYRQLMILRLKQLFSLYPPAPGSLIASFDPEVLRFAQPFNMPLCALFETPQEWDAFEQGTTQHPEVAALGLNLEILADTPEKCVNTQKTIYIWNANSKDEIRRALVFKPAGIITDSPELLLNNKI
jgi:glycerophosphoryl diester phosphodiesterase